MGGPTLFTVERGLSGTVHVPRIGSTQRERERLDDVFGFRFTQIRLTSG